MSQLRAPGPFATALDDDIHGVVKEELTQYRVKNGMLIKTVVTRDYSTTDSDYTDGSVSIPIIKVA